MLCLVVTCMGPFSTSPTLSISCKSQSHSRLELLLFTIEHDVWTLEFRLHKPPSQKKKNYFKTNQKKKLWENQCKNKLWELKNNFFFFSTPAISGFNF